jgi:hypothetical protein
VVRVRRSPDLSFLISPESNMNRLAFCPDCVETEPIPVNRREFVRQAGVCAAAASVATLTIPAHAKDEAQSASETPESLVEKLYGSLTPDQKKEICFAWDHQDKDRGLLRTHVSNNWSIVDPKRLNVGGEFFTKDQRDVIEAIFYGLYEPEWHDRLKRQLKDDAGGYGKAQTIAIFGEPGKEPWQFVMTGRHLTIRCDGNTTARQAFGGPIFYGHAAQGFYEEPKHPGNVYWPQALKANSLYSMLDGKQQKLALANPAPEESAAGFRGSDGMFPGIPIAELSSDQKAVARDVLLSLLEPYRKSARDEAQKLLDAQGGLDRCSLAFFSKNDNGDSVDVGNDGVWDVWRIEGPSFVWHFRGEPHVHVWVNVADDPTIKLNARG